MYNFLKHSTRILNLAGKAGEIDSDVMKLHEGPFWVVSFRIPLKMDDVSFRVFDAHRVRYNDALGPSRDGTLKSLRTYKYVNPSCLLEVCASWLPAHRRKPYRLARVLRMVLKKS